MKLDCQIQLYKTQEGKEENEHTGDKSLSLTTECLAD